MRGRLPPVVVLSRRPAQLLEDAVSPQLIDSTITSSYRGAPRAPFVDEGYEEALWLVSGDLVGCFLIESDEMDDLLSGIIAQCLGLAHEPLECNRVGIGVPLDESVAQGFL